MKTRSLKIELAGDPFEGVPVHPKIRIAGQWLERLGFLPGGRVEVIPGQSGELILRTIRSTDSEAARLNFAAVADAAMKVADARLAVLRASARQETWEAA